MYGEPARILQNPTLLTQYPLVVPALTIPGMAKLSTQT